MDFDFDEQEQAISDLSRRILDDKVTHESLRALAQADTHVDIELWRTLADAGLVGAGLPEEHGGAGLGFLAVTALLEEVGRHAAPVPVLETVVMAGLPIAAFGSAAQRQSLLPRIAAGELLATAALVPGPGASVHDHTISGSLPIVMGGVDAEIILVPTDDGVWLVDRAGPGLTVRPRQTTTGHPVADIELTAVPAERLGDRPTTEIVDWIRLRVDAAICSMLAGACRAALDLAAEYAKERHQFDRAIATFQAVSQRAADAYIDTEAVELTSRQAAWRIATDRPAEDQVAIARWWASEAGFRVVHAATHLHGGVGVDRDYPLHRFFLMVRQLEMTLGNSEEQLERLGDLIAERA